MIEYKVYLVRRDSKAFPPSLREQVLGEWNVSRDVDLRATGIGANDAARNFVDGINAIIDADPMKEG